MDGGIQTGKDPKKRGTLKDPGSLTKTLLIETVLNKKWLNDKCKVANANFAKTTVDNYAAVYALTALMLKLLFCLWLFTALNF